MLLKSYFHPFHYCNSNFLLLIFWKLCENVCHFFLHSTWWEQQKSFGWGSRTGSYSHDKHWATESASNFIIITFKRSMCFLNIWTCYDGYMQVYPVNLHFDTTVKRGFFTPLITGYCLQSLLTSAVWMHVFIFIIEYNNNTFIIDCAVKMSTKLISYSSKLKNTRSSL